MSRRQWMLWSQRTRGGTRTHRKAAGRYVGMHLSGGRSIPDWEPIAGQLRGPSRREPSGASPFPKSIPDCSFPKWRTGHGATGKSMLNEWPLSGAQIARLDVRVWAFTDIRSDVWDYHFFSTRRPSHNLPGPRNVAMPLSAEMPAPVRTTMFRISCIGTVYGRRRRQHSRSRADIAPIDASHRRDASGCAFPALNRTDHVSWPSANRSPMPPWHRAP